MPRKLTDLDVLHGIFEPALDNEWMHRLNKAIKDNKWQKPPSIYEANFYLGSALKYVHFPHIDPTDPNKIRFTESIASGRKDKMTSMRIGRYLTKYFKSQIGSEAYILATQQAVVYETAPVNVLFASTEDEVERVYSQGPRSCMSKATDTFQTGGTHPCRGYIAGDLQVAYIIGQDGNKPGARAVVWPDKKQYVRIYGDSARMKRGLNSLGYDKVSDFDGARIQRLPYRGSFIVPYVDGNARYVQPQHLPNESHMHLRLDQSLIQNVDCHEIRSEWGWLWEPNANCSLCESVGYTDSSILNYSMINPEGARSHIQLCEDHHGDRDTLHEELALNMCNSCHNLYQTHDHHIDTDEWDANTCARCIIRG